MRRAAPILVALVVAACSGGGGKHTAPSRPPVSSTTTLTAPAPPAGRFPLTGMPTADAARAARPALTVKIENEPGARPQSGLQAADLVYEEFIEGGDTRFVAVFQSTDADPVGSIRSVRPSDPLLVRPLGGLFSYSGGTAKFVNLLHAAPVVDVGISAAPGAYFQRREKSAEHLAQRFPTVGSRASPRSLPLFWPGLLPRNLLFLSVVLAHGIRRLLPPY